MKNFARLVRFAWPYRVRFGVSLACAGVVALMWVSNLGAVYPLLKILFDDKTCQSWLAEQAEGIETDIKADRARVEELDLIRDLGPGSPALRGHVATVRERSAALHSELEDLQLRFDDLGPRGTEPGELQRRKAALAVKQHEYRVVQARVEELGTARAITQKAGTSGLAPRREALGRALKDLDRRLAWYRWAQPRADRLLPHDPFRTLLLLLALVLGGAALKGAFLFLQEVLVAQVQHLSLFDIRNLFYRRTMALDLAHFSDQGTAELMARFTNDMESVSQGINILLSKVMREPLRVVACLGAAIWWNWRLTCLTLILVPISAATTYRAGKIMKRAVRKSLESMSNIYKILQESLQGIKVVKAYTMERRERRRFFRETKALLKKSVRVARIEAMSDPVLEMLSLSTVAIALLAGSYLVLRRTTVLDLGLLKLQLATRPMQIADLLTLYALLAGVSDPVRKLANVHSRIQRAAAAADRICVLMDRKPEVAERPSAPRLPRHAATIEFDHVTFSYDGREPVLRGLTLTARHGETIAIVGPNGCGKSTLMNLLPRFYDVAEGAIRIDGVDLRDVRLRSLRAQIGMVTQETILFEATLAENIAYGSPHATRPEVEAAAKRSYAHGFISALPEGYDTHIGERGSGLSGGQRQRIALARAMLRDPAILILDEATSAVDIQDEALIRKAIEEFSRGRTTFLITHSLGSLQFADRIILMDAGRIVAAGTDAELRHSSPLYRRLHEIQFRRESA